LSLLARCSGVNGGGGVNEAWRKRFPSRKEENLICGRPGGLLSRKGNQEPRDTRKDSLFTAAYCLLDRREIEFPPRIGPEGGSEGRQLQESGRPRVMDLSMRSSQVIVKRDSAV
jgi:hypothetical protein